MSRKNEKDSLDHLGPTESVQVLRELLKRHEDLRGEANEIARGLLGDVSVNVEAVAEDVAYLVKSIGIEELGGRAGSHSWGYVEPGEAAWDLLEESLEEIRADMKRRVEAGMKPAAEKLWPPVDDVASLSCLAESLGIECTGTATPATHGIATSFCCDVVAQDCPTGSHCTIIDTEEGAEWLVTGCMPDEGTAGLGESCERIGEGSASIGHDTCVGGTYCANWLTESATERACVQLCSTNDDCNPGSGCLFGGSVPPAGGCIETCDPMSEPSTCPGTTQCLYLSTSTSAGVMVSPLCVRSTGLATGEVCAYGNDCAAGDKCELDSDGAFRCLALCADDHPCPAGFTCTPSQASDFTGAVPSVCITD